MGKISQKKRVFLAASLRKVVKRTGLFTVRLTVRPFFTASLTDPERTFFTKPFVNKNAFS